MYVWLAYTRQQRKPDSGMEYVLCDSYDNAMAESINGLYKAEVIHRKSWENRTRSGAGVGDWYNNRLLLESLGHIPPSEAEKAYYASIGNDELAA